MLNLKLVLAVFFIIIFAVNFVFCQAEGTITKKPYQNDSSKSAVSEPSNFDSENDYKYPLVLMDASFGEYWSLSLFYTFNRYSSPAFYYGFGFSQNFETHENPPGVEVDGPPFSWWVDRGIFETTRRSFYGEFFLVTRPGLMFGLGLDIIFYSNYEVYYSTASYTDWHIFKEDKQEFGVLITIGYLIANKFYLKADYSTVRSFGFGVGIATF